VAAPVFVVGTSGVFVSSVVYHSYHAAKKLATDKKGLILQ
jgi:hypothetical protein